MKKNFKNLALVIVVALITPVVLFIENDCLAQSSTVSSDKDERVLQKDRLAQDIDQTKQELLSKLENYNQIEKKYRIALNQYQSHQTLSSIEEAVNTARAAMLSRNDVLITYLKLLKFKLIESEGVEVTHKKRALNQIEQMLVRLGQFGAKVEPVEDRIKLNQLADEFNQLGPEIEETSYYTLNLLSLGKLQAVYDQAKVLEKKIEQEQASTGSKLDQAADEQALKETQRLIEAINPMLQEVWTDISQVKQDNSTYQSQYRRLFDDLNPIYAKLSQLVSYLEELMNS
jgi:hypothetical protein